MSQIMTVRGPVRPEELGVTSMHEHVLKDERPFLSLFPRPLLEQLKDVVNEPISLENVQRVRNLEGTLDNMLVADEEVMTAEVADFRKSGGSAMVDMSPLGVRSDLAGIRRISETTGVHIVATTGIFFGNHLAGDTPRGDDLEALMIKEIETGIGDSGIRAGHIKVGITDLTEKDVEDLRAVARVVIDKGLSVSVHPGFGIGNDGRAIAAILSEEGMPLNRLVVSHGDNFIIEGEFRRLILEKEGWALQLDYHRALLDRGVTVAFDSFGTTTCGGPHGITWPTDWMRLAAVVALIGEDYASQIVLGTDMGLKTRIRRYGGHGYAHLMQFVLPALKEVGVSDYVIRKITVENPARILAC